MQYAVDQADEVRVAGGTYSQNTSNPVVSIDETLTNVTLTTNWAVFGDGIYNRYSSPSLTNCIVWGESSGEYFSRTWYQR